MFITSSDLKRLSKLNAGNIHKKNLYMLLVNLPQKHAGKASTINPWTGARFKVIYILL